MSQTDTQLLRACLLEGRACELAWVEFVDSVKDPLAFVRTSSSEIKGLLPQLFAALQSTSVKIEGQFGTNLKAAYVREQARHQSYTRLCIKLLSAFEAANVSYLLFSGNALAEVCYEPAFLRHSSGLEVMVAPSELQAAVDAASHADFIVGSDKIDLLRGARCKHRSGVELALSTRFTTVIGPDRLIAQAWQYSERKQIAGHAIRTLAAADAFFEVCGRALWPSTSHSLLWVCDGSRLLARTPEMDWDRIVSCARAFAVCEQMRGLLGYLTDNFEARVPDKVLNKLAHVTSKGWDTGIATARPMPSRSGGFDTASVRQGRCITPDIGSISFSIGGAGAALASYGWANPEKSGRWTLGHTAQLALRLPESLGRELVISLELRPFIVPAHPNLDVDVLANGTAIDRWSYRAGAPLQKKRELRLSSELLNETPLRIEFRVIDPCSPASLGVSSDDRALGIRLRLLEMRWIGLAVRKTRRYRPEFPSVLPNTEQQLLLKAALLPGDAAAQAWRQWRARDDLDPTASAYWGLLPLVFINREAAGVNERDIPTLKSAYYSTWEKNTRQLRRLVDLATSLGQAGIAMMLLKGAGLIGDYRDDPGLRPMNDIDILVLHRQRFEAIAVLTQLGFEPLGGPRSEAEWRDLMEKEHAWSFCSPKLGAIDLHWRVLHTSQQLDADDDFWSGAEQTELFGFKFHRLDAADRLLHVCVHGMRWDISGTVRWIPDAVMILNTFGSTMDWPRFVHQAQRHRAVAAISQALSFLTQSLAIAIPAEVMRQLTNAAVTPTEHMAHGFVSRTVMDNSPAVRFALRYEEAVSHQASLHQPNRLRALMGCLKRCRSKILDLALFAAFIPLTCNGRLTSRLAGTYCERLRRATPASYRIGSTIRFTLTRSGWRYMREGWSWPAGGGTWSEGPTARIVLAMRQPPPGNYILQVSAMPHVSENFPFLSVDVAINGTTIGTMEFCNGQDVCAGFHNIPFSGDLLAERAPAEIVFHIYDPHSQKSHEFSEDVRSLGVFLSRLRIVPANCATGRAASPRR